MTRIEAVAFCHCQGSNTNSAIYGTELIISVKSGNDWVDPPTCHIIRALINYGVANQQLRPSGGSLPFFSRMRIPAGGRVFEVI